MNSLRRVGDVIINVFFIAMIFCTFIDVVFRIVPFLPSMFWPQEVTRYSLIWLALTGSAVAIRRNEHMGLSFLHEKLPKKIRLSLFMLSNIVVIIFLAVMVIYGFKMSISNLNQNTIALGISMAIPYLAIPIGSLLMILETVCTIFEEFQN